MTSRSNSSEPDDAEPGYIHSVAPYLRRLEPLNNPVSSTYLIRPTVLTIFLSFI